MTYQFTDNSLGTVSGAVPIDNGFIRIKNLTGNDFSSSVSVSDPQIITVISSAGLEVMELTDIVPTPSVPGSYDCTVVNGQHGTVSIAIDDNSKVYADVTAKMMADIFSQLASPLGFKKVPSKELLFFTGTTTGTWNIDSDGPLVAKASFAADFGGSATINLNVSSLPLSGETIHNKMILMVSSTLVTPVNVTLSLDGSISGIAGILYTDSHSSDNAYGVGGAGDKILSLSDQR